MSVREGRSLRRMFEALPQVLKPLPSLGLPPLPSPLLPSPMFSPPAQQGVGAYRTEELQPYVLKVVRKVSASGSLL